MLPPKIRSSYSQLCVILERKQKRETEILLCRAEVTNWLSTNQTNTVCGCVILGSPSFHPHRTFNMRSLLSFKNKTSLNQNSDSQILLEYQNLSQFQSNSTFHMKAATFSFGRTSQHVSLHPSCYCGRQVLMHYFIFLLLSFTVLFWSLKNLQNSQKGINQGMRNKI